MMFSFFFTDYQEHQRRHTGEQPFQCSECLMKFKTRNSYKRHMITKHPGASLKILGPNDNETQKQLKQKES